MENALSYFIAVILSVNAALLGGIFKDIQKIKDSVQDLLIGEASTKERIKNLEERMRAMES